jgi:hypothetical protein
MSVANLRMKPKGIEAIIGFSSFRVSSFFSLVSFMIFLFLNRQVASVAGLQSVQILFGQLTLVHLIARFEITQRMYRADCGKNPRTAGGAVTREWGNFRTDG